MLTLHLEPTIHPLLQRFGLLGIKIQRLRERGKFRLEITEFDGASQQALGQRFTRRIKRLQLTRLPQQRRQRSEHPVFTAQPLTEAGG